MKALYHTTTSPQSAWQARMCKPCTNAPAGTSSMRCVRAAVFNGQSISASSEDQQVPGMAMPDMLLLRQQMQQAEQQLVQPLQEYQHSSATASQYTISTVRETHQWPVLQPKPQGPASNCSSARTPSTAGIWQLRESISRATTLQGLLELIPHAAAADMPDVTTRLLLQAVSIVRNMASQSTSNSSSSFALLVQQQQTAVQQDSCDTGEAAAVQETQEEDLAVFLQQLDVMQRQQRQQQSMKQQQQQRQDLQLLLSKCDALLHQQAPRLAFQHVSGILWSWSQLGWIPTAAATPHSGQRQSLLRLVINQLIGCEVRRELSGAVSSAGSQLARATTACATLNIQNPKVWDKLNHMIQQLAPSLNPGEVARCAWGLARCHLPPKSNKYPAVRALLIRVEQFVESPLSGFSSVAALNLIWAVAHMDAVHLAPAGVLQRLVFQALGPEYEVWYEQQQLQQQGSQDQAADISSQSTAATAVTPQPPNCRLSVNELAGLVWSLAGMAQNHNKRERAAAARSHLMQQNGGGSKAARRQPSATANFSKTGKFLDPLQWQQQQQQQKQLLLHEDPLLLSYLVFAARHQLQGLGPRQIATLAHSFVLLGPVPAAAAAAATAGLSCQLPIVTELWRKAVQPQQQAAGVLEGFKLVEVHMLLTSVATMHKLVRTTGHKQRQQQQQWGVPVVSVAAEAEALVTAAAQRIISAHDEELLCPCTAAALLHVLVKLGFLQAHPASSTAVAAAQFATSAEHQPRTAAAAAVAVRLLNAVSTSGFSKLKAQQLVVVSATVSQLAAAAARIDAHMQHGGGGSSSSSDVERQVAVQLLQQLALPLAAVARELSLRHVATAVGAYAAAGVPAPQLFDAASRAVLKREVLVHGSSWALTRLLAACATAGHTDERLFAAVADVLVPRLWFMHARVVSRFAWALATTGYHDEQIFCAIASELVSQHNMVQLRTNATGMADNGHSSSSQDSIWNHMQPRDIAALAWSFGVVGYKDPKLYYALATAGVRLIQGFGKHAAQGLGFSFGQLSSLMWGLAAAGVYHKGIVEAVEALMTWCDVQQPQRQPQRQPQQQMPVFLQTACPQDVATMAWSLAELWAASAAVLAGCTAHYVQYSGQYSSSDAADLTWALLWSGWAVQAVQPYLRTETAAHGSSRDDAPGTWWQQQYSVLPGDPVLLQQLLGTATADLEQLSPQQLAQTVLVAAVAAGVNAGSTSAPPAAAGGYECASTASAVQVQLQQLWSAIADWGPSAFTAADAVKLLWAQLVLQSQMQQQQRLTPGQQHQQQSSRGRRKGTAGQQHDEAAGPADGSTARGSAADDANQKQNARVVAVQSKLLAAGARAAMRRTVAVCTSGFCDQVLAALHSKGFAAKTTIQPGSTIAEAAAAAAVGINSRCNIWESLGFEVTCQLLGHVIVDVCSNNAAGSVAASGGGSRCQNKQQQQFVLLMLVPFPQLSRISKTPSAASQPAVCNAPACSDDAQCQHNIIGLGGITSRVVLPSLSYSCNFKSVVLTEADWQAWAADGGEQVQADRLQQLLRNAAGVAA